MLPVGVCMLQVLGGDDDDDDDDDDDELCPCRSNMLFGISLGKWKQRRVEVNMMIGNLSMLYLVI